MIRYKNVREAAELLLYKAGSPRLGNGTAIDVKRIVEEFCKFDLAEIDDLNLGGPILAAFIPTSNTVMVKRNCFEPRKRFSMAHELGHAQLEHGYGLADSLFPIETPLFFRCDDSDIEDGTGSKRRPLAETLADKFATYVLMPENLVRELWRRHQDVSSCAEALIVSRQAMTYRLQELRLT